MYNWTVSSDRAAREFGFECFDLGAEREGTRAQQPIERVVNYKLGHVNAAGRAFIAASPFLVLATAGRQGLDCSPKGDRPGFVTVTDDGRTLLIPDRRGNNRIDGLKNLIEDSRIGLIFFVPGIDETLRVGGKGGLSAEPELLASMVEFGKLPRAVLSIDVHAVYFHCGKALMRSKLWSKDAQVERSALPSIRHSSDGTARRVLISSRRNP